MESRETENGAEKFDCCIAGGGPAGIMLGYLLARAGLQVAVLEKWPDFFRDFRGDTVHPSTMRILDELGLLDDFLKLPHDETKQIAVKIGGKKVTVADFTHIRRTPFLAFMPQWDFLNFLSANGKKFPGFHLMMRTEALDLLKDGDKVIGVKAKNNSGEFEIKATLTVGADGRHSTIREKSGLQVKDLGAPIDVLWFRLPRKDDGAAETLGDADHGKVLILIDRGDYWQCGFLIAKGDFEKIKSRGLESLRAEITMLEPSLDQAAKGLTDWSQIKLLPVAVDHLEQWYQPGLICIGDAAHAMSPVGGIGINLAIQDAVAAANILIPAFRHGGGIKTSDLESIQVRRSNAAKIVQKLQVFIHNHVLAPVLADNGHFDIPWQLKFLQHFPILRRVLARAVGFGYRSEHVDF